MKVETLRISALAIILITWSVQITAQFTLPESPSKNQFIEARKLFEREKYSAARLIFEEIAAGKHRSKELEQSEAAYYVVECAIRMNDKDAELVLKEFVSEHPYDDRNNGLYFEMAHLQYLERRYSKALNWYELVDKTQLKAEDRYTYHFEVGYSNFVKDQVDAAFLSFYEIKDIKGEFYASANYFYGHIAYSTGKYQTALNSFRLLVDDDDFGEIVPFYLIQINYTLGNYEEIMKTGPSLLTKASDKRIAEINHLIGEAYYRTGNYQQAIPYLQKYKETATEYSREDIYDLAYAYYAIQNYSLAIENFEKIARGESALAQNAYFLLADSYLQTGDKTKAYMAFGSASKMDYDAGIAEESMFNYAKLSFDLSYSPFNQTVKIFDDFLRKYPESAYKEMAFDYLVKVFMKTRNYAQAISYLEKIENKNEQINTAYQRATYFRGVEYFLDNDFGRAIQLFEKSLKFGHLNSDLKAQASYWTAEAHYRLGNYLKAMDWYTDYLRLSGAISQPEYASAHYNLAYAYFQQKDFETALSWFRKFTALAGEKNPLAGDAYLRIADVYFKTRQFDQAIKSYDSALKYPIKDADYAMFQKAFSFGLQQQYDKKNWVLRQMIDTYPNSRYRVDAMFEIGKSYHDMNDYPKAIEAYQALIKDFPNSQYVMQAGNQIALIEYNRDETEKALLAYKWVVEQFPASQEARSALEGIERIYMESHRDQEYFVYRDGIKGINTLSVSEKDSLTYLSAEQLYLKGDFEKAKKHFSDYIRDFASGAYILEAYYYKAVCQLKANDEKGALESFAFINSRAANKYSEESQVQSGRIQLKNKNYQDAIIHFRALETQLGTQKYLAESRIAQMQCHFQLKNYVEAINFATAVLLSDQSTDQIKSEAHFILGKSHLANGNQEVAINEFKYINDEVKTAHGAEASYLICEILFNQQKLEECEQEILSFNQKNTPYQYWLAKAIILLSDVYLANNDLFQARHTLESVIQYYGNSTDGILTTAQDKMSQILEREEGENQFKKGLQINLPENPSDSIPN